MPHSVSKLTPIAMRVRNAQADAWLVNCQATSAHLVQAIDEGSRLTVYSVPGGTCLFTVNWRQESITVASLKPAAPYRFSDLPGALCFLNALLMSYVADLMPRANAAAFPPASSRLA